MLRLIVYDIGDPKRLTRVAKICEDFGVRVQKSVFECWLDDQRFEQMWDRLSNAIEKEADQLIAYTLDKKASENRRVAGDHAAVTNRQTSWAF